MAFSRADVSYTIGAVDNSRPAVDSATRGMRNVGDSATSMGSRMASAIRIGPLAMVAAFTAVAASVGKAIDLAGKQEDAERQLANTLKSTGNAARLNFNELTMMAKGLQAVTRSGDEAIIKGQSILLTFTKIGREVFPEALERALDMSQALGQDLQSSIIQLGKALNDPITGVSALSRVGVSFNDTQKETIKKLAEQNDLMGAQKIILSELSSEFGGQARAMAETFSGKVSQLSNAWGDLWEVMGKSITDSPKIVSAIESITGSIQSLTDAIETTPAERITMIGRQLDFLYLKQQELESAPGGGGLLGKWELSRTQKEIASLVDELQRLSQQETKNAEATIKASEDKKAAAADEAQNKALMAQADAYYAAREQERREIDESARFIYQERERESEEENKRMIEYANELYRSRELAAEEENARMIAYAKEFYAAKEMAAEAKKRQFMLQSVSSGFSTMASLAQAFYTLSGNQSKAAFKVYQGFAIAQTVMDTYVAAQKAFASQIITGDPTSLFRAYAAAAAAVVAGLARVQQIASAKPGTTSAGAGAAGGAGVGGGGESYAPPPPPSQAQTAPRPIYVTINAHGAMMTPEDIVEHIKKPLTDAFEDNDIILKSQVVPA